MDDLGQQSIAVLSH